MSKNNNFLHLLHFQIKVFIKSLAVLFFLIIDPQTSY